MKKNLFKPVERVLPSGIRVTFTSRKELEEYDDALRKAIAEKRQKEAENSYRYEVAFDPDFTC